MANYPQRKSLRIRRAKPKRIDNRTAAQKLVTPPLTSAGFAQLDFFDMAVTVTAPTGHREPHPLTLGASWQTNDLRIAMVSASSGANTATAQEVSMESDPPTGFTAAYSLNPGSETEGVYYRYLTSGDDDTEVSWPKPPKWRHFMWGTITARGANPVVAPTAGRMAVHYVVGDSYAWVDPVTVPAAGTMVYFIGNIGDGVSDWPNWPTAMGVPYEYGWKHLAATEKSGVDFYPYDASPALIVIGKGYTAAGSTGYIPIPVGSGSPAFVALYCFVRAAPDVTVIVGAA